MASSETALVAVAVVEVAVLVAVAVVEVAVLGVCGGCVAAQRYMPPTTDMVLLTHVQFISRVSPTRLQLSGF